ncbi:MAG TPA: hypothetical protein VFD00_13235 [Thermoclostridium sp.]|nr:hypothetical protein [Thermoclostridium sp.]
MKMDVLSKSVEKINLKESMTLEQLYDLMKQNSEKMPGKFKLKKGLFGKSILFDVVMQTQPRITVKNNLVTVRRMNNSTSVGVGNMPTMDFKDMKQRAKAVKEGGFGKAISGGAEYFGSACDAMVELLKTYTE